MRAGEWSSDVMKSRNAFSGLLLIAVLASGCEYGDGRRNHTGTGALTGGAIGAGAGALIGGRHAGAGALIGGAVGALSGALIGSSMDEQERARLRAQAPYTYQRLDQGQPLGLADVKALAAARVNDEVIISQIRNTRSVYRLGPNEIIELTNAGVSQRVIEYMINTPGTVQAAPQAMVVAQAPPPPPSETIIVGPGPDHVWIAGEWVWRGGWVWVPGYWARPPRPHAVWVSGYYYRGSRGGHYVGGYWR